MYKEPLTQNFFNVSKDWISRKLKNISCYFLRYRANISRDEYFLGVIFPNVEIKIVNDHIITTHFNVSRAILLPFHSVW